MSKLHDLFFGKEEQKPIIVKKFYNYKCRLCGHIISKQCYTEDNNKIFSHAFDIAVKQNFTDEFHNCGKLKDPNDLAILELISKTNTAPEYANRVIYIEENEASRK